MTEPEVSVIADELDETPIDESPSVDAPSAEGPTADEPTAEPMVVTPDRADAPVSEITERFLRAVVAQIPLDRIEELHLFSPLRQSGVETGIAVVAARVPVVAPVVEMAPELELEDDAIEPVEMQSTDAAELVEVEMTSDDVVDEVADDDADVVVGEVIDDQPVASVAQINDQAIDELTDESTEESTEASASDETADGHALTVDESTESAVPVSHTESIPDAVITPILRHTVYTARYRLVQKGPERGKWESDVVAEADAPLVTVEMVVRGVQRRAGEESEILRYSARQIAKALRMPWPITPAADAPVE